MSTAEAIDFRRRREPGLGGSFALALAMHAVLIAMMFVGVRWQSRPPETVTVELWEAPPPPPVVEAPKPPPEPPKVVPEPPKPEPKPEIVEKAKPKPKPKPKPEAKPKPDRQLEKRMQEEAAREQKALDEQSRAREARETAKRLAAAANKKAVDDWVVKIRTKIRGRITEPPGLTGNPEAIFDVVLLPTGDVLSVGLSKSSGNKGLDNALERAILGASPLPLPDQPGVFQRKLELKIRPRDQ